MFHELKSWVVAVAALAMLVSVLGCGSQPVVEVPQLLELDEEERAVALAQRVCPVDGELLGSKGTPLKVAVQGREVYICSAECEAPLRKNPGRYIEKLEAAQSE